MKVPAGLLSSKCSPLGLQQLSSCCAHVIASYMFLEKEEERFGASNKDSNPIGSRPHPFDFI